MIIIKHMCIMMSKTFLPNCLPALAPSLVPAGGLISSAALGPFLFSRRSPVADTETASAPTMKRIPIAVNGSPLPAPSIRRRWKQSRLQ
jgi:hypothetical protein